MTKKSGSAETNPAQLLLARYKRVEDIIERCRDENRKIGLPESFMKFYVDYSDNVGRYVKYQKFLDQVCNQDGKFYTMPMLKAIRAVKNEVSLHLDGVSYPRRELYNIHRIKTKDGQEILRSGEMWYGLGVDGMEKNVWVEDLQTFCEPIIESILPDPQLRIGHAEEPHTAENKQYQTLVAKKVKLLKVTNHNHMFTATEQGNLTYTTQFSRAAVEQLISEATPKGAFDDKYNGTSLSLGREGVGQSYSIFDLETFCAPSFDELWKKLSTPAPQVDLDVLAEKMKGSIDVNTISKMFEIMKEAGVRTTTAADKDKDNQDSPKDQYR